VGDLDSHGNAKTWVEPVLVRMQRRELLSDVFGLRWNPEEAAGQETIRASLRAIVRAGEGALVYLRTEGAGVDLPGRLARIRRPAKDDVNSPDLTRVDGIGSEGHPMDARLFGVGGQILRDLGLSKLRILTNHPKPMPGLHGFGLDIVEHVPIPG
jgi:3,4-dihydroxy 2-butanone 4-phosphate synthase/GTP cyclohydrolase II